MTSVTGIKRIRKLNERISFVHRNSCWQIEKSSIIFICHLIWMWLHVDILSFWCNMFLFPYYYSFFLNTRRKWQHHNLIIGVHSLIPTTFTTVSWSHGLFSFVSWLCKKNEKKNGSRQNKKIKQKLRHAQVTSLARDSKRMRDEENNCSTSTLHM